MKRLLSVASAILVFAAICFYFYHTREIFVFEKPISASAEEISFNGAEITDFKTLCTSLEPLKNLKKADLGTFPVYPEDAEELRSLFPGVEFTYTPYITLYIVGFPQNSEELDLSNINISDTSELIEKIPSFPNLKKVVFGENTLTEAEAGRLAIKFPSIEFDACVIYNIFGIDVRDDATEIDLTGVNIDESLADSLAVMENLVSVDLHGTSISNQELRSLCSKYPRVEFKADAVLGGKIFDSSSDFIDLNWTKIDDFDLFKEDLKLFPHLEKIEMCETGLTNEQMEELCNTYPGTKFVWRVHMGQWSVRTDAVAFSVLIRNYEHKRLTSKDIEVLKYCTELQALDIGHQAVTDISIIGEYLTELRVLILADNRISDLSPLTKLPHLHYLEFFVNQVTDLTPLASCKELVDLNISYNYKISDITPLLELPLLERLWLERTAVSKADVALLKETYPNARIINIGEGSVDQGWRTHKRYYAMLNMYYNDYMSEEFSKYDGLTAPIED